LYVSSGGSTSTSQPGIYLRQAQGAEFRYNTTNATWNKGQSGMTVTAGGVGNSVLMEMDSWHTVRAEYDPTAATWSIMVDGKTDAAHRMSGTVTGGSGGPYAQWGILSSNTNTNVYTNYLYWGQGSEIDNWPVSKKYDANASAPELANGSFPGWNPEFEPTGTTRGFTATGTLEKSVADAVAAGWLQQASLVAYDGGYKVVKSAGGDDTSIQPWGGYWLKANQAGLTLKIPRPAEAAAGASDVVSSVKLTLSGVGCIAGNFTAGMASSASDALEATRDVLFPPAGPTGAKEVRLGTTLSSSLVLADLRPEPASGAEKVWACTASPVNFGTGECVSTTITWDLGNQGAYSYKLVDVTNNTSKVMTAAGSYTFQACEGGSVSFEIHAKQGEFTVAADLDQDGDVDLVDFGMFQSCFNGPNRPALAGCTVDADFDNDTDVDLVDFGTFQTCFNGPNRPPKTGC
jgi:hypothetical protein